MSCPAKDKGEVPRRGQASAEFYENGKPRYFPRGYIDKMTDELIDTCRSANIWNFSLATEQVAVK